jgi:hypothetical protein
VFLLELSLFRGCWSVEMDSQVVGFREIDGVIPSDPYVVCTFSGDHANHTDPSNEGDTGLTVLLRDPLVFKVGNCLFKSTLYLGRKRYDHVPACCDSDPVTVLWTIDRSTSCESSMTSSFPTNLYGNISLVLSDTHTGATCILSFDNWRTLERWRSTICTVQSCLSQQHEFRLCRRMMPSLRALKTTALSLCDVFNMGAPDSVLDDKISLILAEVSALLPLVEELNSLKLQSADKAQASLEELDDVDGSQQNVERFEPGPTFLGSCIGVLGDATGGSELTQLFMLEDDGGSEDEEDGISSIVSYFDGGVDCSNAEQFWHLVDEFDIDGNTETEVDHSAGQQAAAKLVAIPTDGHSVDETAHMPSNPDKRGIRVEYPPMSEHPFFVDSLLREYSATEIMVHIFSMILMGFLWFVAIFSVATILGSDTKAGHLRQAVQSHPQAFHLVPQTLSGIEHSLALVPLIGSGAGIKGLASAFLSEGGHRLYQIVPYSSLVPAFTSFIELAIDYVVAALRYVSRSF